MDRKKKILGPNLSQSLRERKKRTLKDTGSSYPVHPRSVVGVYSRTFSMVTEVVITIIPMSKRNVEPVM